MRKAKQRCLHIISTSFTCFVFGSLLSDVTRVKIQVPVNKHTTLPCTVHNPNNTVRWFKNPNTVLSYGMHVKSNRMKIVQPYSGEYNLQIDHVQLGDAGEYSCRDGNKVIHHVELIVETSPKIHVTPNMTFQEGDTGTLWCNAIGSPTPDLRWNWKSPHQNEGIGQGSRAEGNRLVLYNITRYYANIYVCSANNTAGSDTINIRVHVNFGPEVEVFQNTVTAVKGQEVTLHCSVAAYPMDGELEWVFLNKNSTIRTDWKYDVSTDETMKNDYYTLFLSLTIRKDYLGDEDYGRYVCRTVNFSRGQSQKELILQKP